MMEIDTRLVPPPIPEDIDNRLESWDLFREGNTNRLKTGKSWPKCLQGTIARQLPWSGEWVVQTIDGANFAHSDPPYLDWYNSHIVIPDEKFIEYMDLFRDVATHMSLVEHDVQLAFALEKKWVKAKETNS